MTGAVILVGPAAIVGPGLPEAGQCSVALDCLDDELALVDDELVPVDELWRNVIRAAMGDGSDGVVLVCPSWWSAPRVNLVEAAAREWCEDVTVLRRVEVLAGTAATVVEIAPDLVVVHIDAERFAIPRVGTSADAVDAVATRLAGRDVVVDIPSGTERFGQEMRRGLRRRGIEVSAAGDQTILRTVRLQRSGSAPRPRRSSVEFSPRTALLAVALLSVTALLVAGVAHHGDPIEGGVTWLVEGRVALEVPADWTVQRVASGPGSARVQVISPSNRDVILHVTQSRVPAQQTLDAAADTLRAALAEQPEGVFVDFAALDRKADRPVVSYREIRADRDVAWAVLLDRGVRIAIGCQGARDRPGPDQVCDRAVRSAHAVASK